MHASILDSFFSSNKVKAATAVNDQKINETVINFLSFFFLIRVKDKELKSDYDSLMMSTSMKVGKCQFT